MKYASLLLFLVLFAGCSYKNFPAHQEGEKTLDFGMVNSKKIELVQSDSKVKTYVVITYLNPIKHPLITQEREKFLIGTYQTTGEYQSNSVFLKNFTINELTQGELFIQKLSYDNPLLSLVSSANPWMEYLLVEAPKSDKIEMLMGFETDRSKRVSVTFQKDY